MSLPGGGAVTDALIARLESMTALSKHEADVLRKLPWSIQQFRRNRDIMREAASAAQIHLILSGYAVRYAIVDNGERQITSVLMPGDFCDLISNLLGRTYSNVAAVTDVTIAVLPDYDLRSLQHEYPRLWEAVWRLALVEAVRMQRWIVNLGRRDARARIASLLAELHDRVAQAGLLHANGFDLPLTQEAIADATGMTSVHANRTLQELRAEQLIIFRSGHLEILDLDRLRAAGGYQPVELERQHAG